MSFQGLPDEIILEIVSQVAYRPPLDTFSLHMDISQKEEAYLQYDKGVKCFCALILCNRQFQSIVEPILYSKVFVWKLQQMSCFHRTIADRADLGGYVKQLFLQERRIPIQIHGLSGENTRGLGSSHGGEDGSEWDRASVVLLQAMSALFNLQSFGLEKNVGGKYSSLPWYDGPLGGRNPHATGAAIPKSLRHLTLSNKGDEMQQLSPGNLFNFLTTKSATTLHLDRLRVASGPQRYLSPGFTPSTLKELQLYSCLISPKSLTYWMRLLPHLERFSMLATMAGSLSVFSLRDILSCLSSARHNLKQFKLLSLEIDPQDRNFYPIQDIMDERISLDQFTEFPTLTCLKVDATCVLATSETDPNLKVAFLANAIQPWLRHLTLYRCDFGTYKHVSKLAEIKEERGLSLEKITLQFHPDFPHWPTAIDPARSLVGAEVRENMAFKTKVIEREYEELLRGQTFTSTPASWSRPLPNPLIPTKEINARMLCEASGIILDVQKSNLFDESTGRS